MKTLIPLTLVLMTFLFNPAITVAQDQSSSSDYISQLMFKASETNSPTLWTKAIDQLQKTDDSPSTQLQLAYAYYGLSSAHLATRDKKSGKAAIEQGLSLAKRLVDHSEYGSQAHALIGGLYGLSIAYSPMKGMYLGAKSDKHINTALSIDEKCAFAWLQKGSSQYNTPKLFGGDVKESIKSFQRAIDLYDQCEGLNWQRGEAIIWLGQAYHRSDQINKAIDTYHLALEAMPQSAWVKNVLLPKAIAAKS